MNKHDVTLIADHSSDLEHQRLAKGLLHALLRIEALEGRLDAVCAPAREGANDGQ